MLGPALADQAPGAGMAKEMRAVASSCRADMQRLCADTRPGGGRIVECLRDNAEALSPDCNQAMSAMGEGRADATSPPKGATVTRNLAYGDKPKQRMDVYLPAHPQNAPIIVMVHGGAWAFGSKDASGVVANKVAHFLPRGYIFVSVETRLIPQADPLQQAGDVAAALASVQQKAASWGGDPSKLVLIGHSAGAHLVALVSADRTIAETAGAGPWLATVALDSAAYDVSAIMNRQGHPKLYDKAFGKDPDFWKQASPTLQLSAGATTLPPMLLVCSSLRDDSCPQAKTFASKAAGKAKVLPVALRHMPINAELGADNDYTRQVDAFLASVGVK
jgi:acetyl esterase/lipase